MSITNHIKENPFAAIGLLLTLLGVGFSVVNFIILNRVEPLAGRVTAIEARNSRIDTEIPRMWQYVEKIDRMEKTVDKIADKLGVLN